MKTNTAEIMDSHAVRMLAHCIDIEALRERGPEGLAQDYQNRDATIPWDVGIVGAEAHAWASAGWMIGGEGFPIPCPSLRWPDSRRAIWQKVVDSELRKARS